LLLASLALLLLWLLLRLEPRGGGVLAVLLGLWLGLAALAAAAHAGVVCRWHPLARLGVHVVGWGGLVAGLLAAV
jgi:hypothetical protein